MLDQIVGVLLPVVFVLALGFAAGKAKAFPKDAVAVLSELVLDFALPASLFAGTIGQTREQIVSGVGLFLALLVAFVVVFAAAFAAAKLVFHHDTATAGLQALAVGFSAAPFFGPAIAGDFFGSSGTLALGLCALVLNLVLVPAGTIAIGIGVGGSGKSLGRTIGGALLSALKAPYVWAPLLALVLVLVGVRISKLFISPLQLIGSTTSGIALFVAGLSVASVAFKLSLEVIVNSIGRVIISPLLVAGFALLFGVSGKGLQEGVVLAALPTGTIAILLANRYHRYQSEASSTLAVTTVALIPVLPALVLLLGLK